jgi:hypothetical protein
MPWLQSRLLVLAVSFRPLLFILLIGSSICFVISLPELLSLLLEDRIAVISRKPRDPWPVHLAPTISALQLSLMAFILRFVLEPEMNYDCVNRKKKAFYDLLG